MSFTKPIINNNLIIYKDLLSDLSVYNKCDISNYTKSVIEQIPSFDFVIVILWSTNGKKMCDVWYYWNSFDKTKFNYQSGPLCDVQVFDNTKAIEKSNKLSTGSAIASGNTLLLLANEEKLRKCFDNLPHYLTTTRLKWVYETQGKIA